MKYTAFFFLLCTHIIAIAQDDDEQGAITGVIVDESGQPVPFGNAAVYAASDSTLITGAVSDANGNFQINIKPGTYFLKITFLSFHDKIIDGVDLKDERLDLGKITLIASTDVLEEVVVRGEKDLMELQLDKRVFNVGKDLSNAGANAADILGNLPSISVGVDGEVSLRGSENVTIWINGRPSSLTSRDPDALRKLQGSMIESVEVITNPSSRFDAAGEVGIINIILKKNQEKGFNGSFLFNAGYPSLYGGSYNLNYRSRNINFFSSYGLDYRKSPGKGTSYQEFTSADTSFTYVQRNNRSRGGLSHNIRAGMDYFLNDLNSITGAITYNPSNSINDATTEYFDYDANDLLANTTIRTEREAEDEKDVEVALTYNRNFKEKDRNFSVNGQWVRSEDNESTNYTQSLPDGSNKYQRAVNNANETNWLFQTDYIHPIGENTRVEAGLKSTTRIIRNEFSLEEQDGNLDWIPFDAFTNNLVYTERIHAVYLMGSSAFGKFSVQGGLRGELSDITTELTVSDEINEQRYGNLFPSAGLSYEFKKNNTLQMSYSYRISRPNFRNLLPFSDFRDPRVYFVGNPNLRPEYTHSYEAGYLLNWSSGSILSSVYHRHRTDVIQRITETPGDDGVTRIIPVNLAVQNALGVEFNLSFTVSNWWKVNTNANFYRAVTEGAYREERLYSDTYTWTNRTTSKMSFFKNLDFQVSFNYRAPRITPQGKDLSIYSFDLGLSRDVLGGKGTVTAGVRDLFNSRKRRSVIDTQGYYSNSEFQWRARQFTVTFSYRLNREKDKQGSRRGSETNDDDEF